MSRATHFALIAALLLGACVAGDPRAADRASSVRPTVTATRSPDPTASRSDDLRYLIREARSIHPNLHHSLSRISLRRHVQQLEEKLADLSDDEFMVEVMRLTAMFGRGGRDGHTGLFPFDQYRELHAFPLRVYLFPEGVYVVDAIRKYRHLIGKKVIAIDGTPMSAIHDELAPLVSRDNPQTVRARLPWIVVVGEVLHGAGLVEDPTSATFRFRDRGRPSETTLAAIGSNEFQSWADIWHPMMTARLPHDPAVRYLDQIDAHLWVDYLRRDDVVYLQYNTAIVETGDAADRLRRMVRRHDPVRVIVDVRHNPGGNNHTYRPLLDALDTGTVDQPGKLVVLIGRNTFSAAGNFVADLERRTQAVFVGEPTGSSPNQYGDPVAVELPHSGLVVEIAGFYWMKSYRRDPRITHRPHVPVVLRAADFFGHRDPVLDRALIDL